MKARVKLPIPKPEMNRWEADFAENLEWQKRAGDIVDYSFGKITFKLADGCRYTPDFFVIDKNGYLQFWEVKGFFRDDAKVKIKVAAEQNPHFSWFVTRKERGVWVTNEL
jgi:hypothetical protein